MSFHRAVRMHETQRATPNATDGLASRCGAWGKGWNCFHREPGVGCGGRWRNKGATAVAGVDGLVAGAMSMAAGEYVSVSSQSDTERADLPAGAALPLLVVVLFSHTALLREFAGSSRLFLALLGFIAARAGGVPALRLVLRVSFRGALPMAWNAGVGTPCRASA